MLKFGEEKVDFFQRCKYTVPFIMHSPHIHDYHELYFLVEGKTAYFVGNSIYIMNAGDFIFIPKGQLHQTDNSRYPRLERVLLNFDSDFVGEEYGELLDELSLSPHIRLPDIEIPRFRKIVGRIEEETRLSGKSSILLQKTYLCELIALLLRHRTKSSAEEVGSAYKIAQETAKYISENCKGPLNLSILAKEFSVSEGHLSKLFKRYTGMGVNQYINISRVMAAKELFDSTDLSVTEAAYECGFNDSNYFSQVFKKVAGLTPKKYAMSGKRQNINYD